MVFIRGSIFSILIEEGVVFIGGGAFSWLEDDNSSISIGKNSSFFGDVLIDLTESSSISIGSKRFAAAGV